MGDFKYTKAVAVTPHDSTDLTTVSDALYIGTGDYTTSVANTDLAPSTTAPLAWNYASDVGSTRSGSFLENNGLNDTITFRATYEAGTGIANVTVVTDDTKLNSLSYVKFTGLNHWLGIADTSGLDWSADFALIMLVKFTDIGNDNIEYLVCKDDSDSTWAWYKDASNVMTVATGGTDPTSGVTLVNDTWYILELSRVSGTMTQYVNGVNYGTAASNTTNLSGSDDLYIGKRNHGTKYSFIGGLAEMMMWKGGITAADRTNIVNYLEDKYLLPTKTDVTYVDAESNATLTKRLTTGTVHPLRCSRVNSTATDGSNIIALYK